MLCVRGGYKKENMEANKAREISETFDNSLKDMLYAIKCMAKCGNITATWSREDRIITERELSELRKLGYKIIRDEAKWVTVGW